MSPSEAIKPHPRGCIVSFEIVPGCSRLAVPSGYNPWRRSIEARLTEEPIKGKANRQLIEELARTLGISQQNVEVMSGQKSSKKTVLVKGIMKDDVFKALAQKLKTKGSQALKEEAL
jgi:uncharacterized protein (TIGR00251 family)